jgi:hypothetical protein
VVACAVVLAGGAGRVAARRRWKSCGCAWPFRHERLLDHVDSLDEHVAHTLYAEAARFEQQRLLLVDICAAYEQNAPFERVAELMERISSLGQAPPTCWPSWPPTALPPLLG